MLPLCCLADSSGASGAPKTLVFTGAVDGIRTVDQQQPELSIVIPSYNEEERLAPTLDQILAYVRERGLDTEILVVDDGSSDRTAEVAREFGDRKVQLLQLERNQGKGAATNAGVLASRGRKVLISDADLSTPIQEIAKLESHLDKAEIAIGSRATKDSRIVRHQPLYRELMGKTFNKLLRLFGVRGISDTQCGFKLLRGDVARELFQQMVTPGFAFDVELLWLAQRAGYQIAEVGVTWENSPATRVHPLLDPPRMMLEVLRFRWAHRGGR